MWRVLWIMCLVACGSVPHARTEPVDIDHPFVLPLGQQVRWAAADLTLRFEQVLIDSRCPRGEHCVVAGVARIRVRVDGPGQLVQQLDLQLPDRPTAPLPGQAATVTLLRLDPYPTSGQAAMSAAALATMVIRRAAASDR